MGLDLWFREDVARVLASTQEAMRNSLGAVAPADLKTAGAYQQGFVDAIRAVAFAFGIVPESAAESGHRWRQPTVVQPDGDAGLVLPAKSTRPPNGRAASTRDYDW